MNDNPRVLVYMDGVPIGGHEYMTARLIEELAGDQRFTFIAAGSDDFLRLFSGKVEKVPCPLPPRRASASLGLFWLKDWLKLRQLFLNSNPDVVLVGQGTIEYGIKAVILAKLMRIRVISYLPMVTNLTAAHMRFFPRTRDALNRLMYRIPDAFITISQHAQQQLLEFRKRAKDHVAILTNWIALPPATAETADEKALFDWLRQEQKSGRIVAAVVGRIEFAHKQQDQLIAALAANNARERLSIAFVGAGADATRLREIIRRSENSRLYGPVFCRNLQKLYGLLDVLIVCSSLEGVPLVILEAISCHLKVISFDFPSLAGYLEKEDTVPIGDFPSLLATIANAKNNVPDITPNKLNYLQPICEQIELIKRMLLDECC